MYCGPRWCSAPRTVGGRSLTGTRIPSARPHRRRDPDQVVLDVGMTELVQLDVTDGVATVTLDSPHNKNALSQQLTGELLERLDSAGTDELVRVIVIRSALDVFCS